MRTTLVEDKLHICDTLQFGRSDSELEAYSKTYNFLRELKAEVSIRREEDSTTIEVAIPQKLAMKFFGWLFEYHLQGHSLSCVQIMAAFPHLNYLARKDLGATVTVDAETQGLLFASKEQGEHHENTRPDGSGPGSVGKP